MKQVYDIEDAITHMILYILNHLEYSVYQYEVMNTYVSSIIDRYRRMTFWFFMEIIISEISYVFYFHSCFNSKKIVDDMGDWEYNNDTRKFSLKRESKLWICYLNFIAKILQVGRIDYEIYFNS